MRTKETCGISMKIFNKILKVKTTFVSRENTNERLYKEANRRLRENTNNE